MRVDAIIGFEQTDENQYVLTIRGEVPNHVKLWMDTMDAVRLYSLLNNVIGTHVREGEAVKASYDRGEGPNGEAPGTWEYNLRGGDDVHSLHYSHFACDDPERDYIEYVRHTADLDRKARWEGM